MRRNSRVANVEREIEISHLRRESGKREARRDHRVDRSRSGGADRGARLITGVSGTNGISLSFHTRE